MGLEAVCQGSGHMVRREPPMRADDWHSFPSSFLLVAACPFSAWGRQAACRVPQGSMPCSPGVDRRCLWASMGPIGDVPCRTGVMWAETSAPLSDISLFCISLSDYLSQHVTMLDHCLHAAFSVFPAACAEMGGLLEALPYLWRGPLRPRSNQDFAFARRLARCNAVPCLRSPKILQF